MPFRCFKKTHSIQKDDGSNSNIEAAKPIEYGKQFSDRDSFFVITTIFNPVQFKSRYELYHGFARHMAQTGAQLITIECIFPSLGQNKFQVTDSRNPFHIQLTSKSVYWMKENLINIAASRLPPHAKWICWLDADIEFEDKNWVDLAIEKLKENTIVQVFKKCKFLGPNPELQKVVRLDYSFGYSVIHDKPIDQKRYDEWYPHTGYGWAISKLAFQRIHGLPEYDILGSADLHFAFSLINKTSNAIEDNLNPAFRNLILHNSTDTYVRLSELNKRIVGYVPVTIKHHWHGDRQDRQYVNRWKILIAHQFDFLRDMRRTENGLLEFIPGLENLQEDILQHFVLRNEDGKEEKTNISQKPKPILKYEKEKHKVKKHNKKSNSSGGSGSSDVPIYFHSDNEAGFPDEDCPCEPDTCHSCDSGDNCKPCPRPCLNDDYRPFLDDESNAKQASTHHHNESHEHHDYIDNYGGAIATSSYY